MAVTVLIGDMFASKAQTLVNTVNCVGVMGKGVALQFQRRFPEMYADYVRRCERKSVRLGEPYLWRPLIGTWVLNFPTKDHWRSVSKLSDIEAGLLHLEKHYKEWGITSLAVPPLGCGQGGLEWRVVGRTLYRHLRRLEIPVELFAPAGTPNAELQASFLETEAPHHGEHRVSKIEAGWVALATIVEKVTNAKHHWPIGRIGLQKMAYFATALGIPTGLTFVRGSYGPFAEDMKSVVTKLVNNGILREEKQGRMFVVVPGSTYADAYRAYGAAIDPWLTAIEKIADLFRRMQTDQAELAATVLFVTKTLKNDQPRVTEADVLRGVLAWKIARFDQERTARCIRHLNTLSWLDLEASVDLPGLRRSISDIEEAPVASR